VKNAASPARSCRRRRCAAVAALLCSSVGAIAPSRGGDRISTPAETSPPKAAPSCSAPGSGWCLARRFPGTVPRGELGFRFGEPLDVDGDGRADVAAGARFELRDRTLQSGNAAIWSGASGALIREWHGGHDDGLFGHWVLPIPDLSGDGLADVVIAAPHAPVADGHLRGIVVARSPKTGEELWRHEEAVSENLGWDLTLAGDQDGDRHPDLFVGAPAEDASRVYLLNGKDGSIERTYAPREPAGSFGWYVARLDDLDGDGRADFVTGAPFARDATGTSLGAAWVFSSSGKELLHWTGTDPRGGFGGVVTGVADLDGDGKGDVAIAAPATEDQTRTLPGELWIYSTATGKELRHWTGTQPGEQFGRMIVETGDLDGDGTNDVAIGAPWYRRDGADKVGRVELRSARSGAVLGELGGDEGDCWFGWHIRRAPDLDGHGRQALLISSLRHPIDGNFGVGVLDLYVARVRAP
jgi:hypothetical protein